MPDKLDPEVNNYLVNSGSMQSTPIERLISMNTPAVKLYKEHGIDLATEPLEVGVCAQHNNGGLKGNIWWESDLRHLFPVGEVNGSHGVYRPGGSALNSGQVGSNRASEFICRRYNDPMPDSNQFLAVSTDAINSVLELATFWLKCGKSNLNKGILEEIQQRMSKAGSIIRDRGKVSEAVAEAFSLFKDFKDKVGASSVRDLAECFRISDNCLTHMLYLEAIRSYIEKKGRSRGSYIITNNEESVIPEISAAGLEICICSYDREVESGILEINFRNGDVAINIRKVKEIALQNLWFEKVWKDYIEDNYIES